MKKVNNNSFLFFIKLTDSIGDFSISYLRETVCNTVFCDEYLEYVGTGKIDKKTLMHKIQGQHATANSFNSLHCVLQVRFIYIYISILILRKVLFLRYEAISSFNVSSILSNIFSNEITRLSNLERITILIE